MQAVFRFCPFKSSNIGPLGARAPVLGLARLQGHAQSVIFHTRRAPPSLHTTTPLRQDASTLHPRARRVALPVVRGPVSGLNLGVGLPRSRHTAAVRAAATDGSAVDTPTPAAIKRAVWMSWTVHMQSCCYILRGEQTNLVHLSHCR